MSTNIKPVQPNAAGKATPKPKEVEHPVDLIDFYKEHGKFEGEFPERHDEMIQTKCMILDPNTVKEFEKTLKKMLKSNGK